MLTNQASDLTGLRCPMPIVRLAKLVSELDINDQVTVIADDPAFCLDVKSWCNKTGHELISQVSSNDQHVAIIRKRDPESK